MKDKCISVDMVGEWPVPRQCLNDATVEYKGEKYCDRHDPDIQRIRARQEEARVENDKFYERLRVKKARADLCVSVLADFSDSALSDGVVGEMVEAIKLALDAFEKNYAIDWSVFECILAKLEGNDG